MTTVAQENRKYLRQSMRVDCGFRETIDEPTAITPIGAESDYEALANLGHEHLTTILMDLGGDGFLNDGRAVPMQTDTDSFRYGYISSAATKSDGTFTTPFGLEIEAARNWDQVTLEIMDQDGNIQTRMIDAIWIAGKTTIYIDSFTPNSRVYIVGVYLGRAWIWNEANLLSVNLDLRSVSTEIGGELEVSSISIEAYEPTDPTEYIGDIPLGAPIWYIAGYEGDLAPQRLFYLSEMATWEDNVLTVQGQDATSLLDGLEVPFQWLTISSNVVWAINYMLEKALDTIDYDTINSYPSIAPDLTQDIYFETMAPRTILSWLTGLYRDPDLVRVTYVDAGRPCLTWGDTANTFTIYADEIADFKVLVSQNINEIDVNLASYAQGNLEEFERWNAVANRTYYFYFDKPITTFHIEPGYSSYQFIGISALKIVAGSTAETVLSVRYLEPIIEAGNNPYEEISLNQGVPYVYDPTTPLFTTLAGSLTQNSLPALLDRSNRVYEFTYRGDPHIQPRDVLNVEVATWEDFYETTDGLFPAEDLYPATDLYPYAVYEKVRKMVKHWEVMTVDSVTLEHREGGLTSTIRARKGVV